MAAATMSTKAEAVGSPLAQVTSEGMVNSASTHGCESGVAQTLASDSNHLVAVPNSNSSEVALPNPVLSSASTPAIAQQDSDSSADDCSAHRNRGERLSGNGRSKHPGRFQVPRFQLADTGDDSASDDSEFVYGERSDEPGTALKPVKGKWKSLANIEQGNKGRSKISRNQLTDETGEDAACDSDFVSGESSDDSGNSTKKRKRKRRVNKRRAATRSNDESQREKKRHLMCSEFPPACEHCGRAASSFVTAGGYQRHLASCGSDEKPLSAGALKCPVCGKQGFATSQAYGAHRRCCYVISASSPMKSERKEIEAGDEGEVVTSGDQASSLRLMPSCLKSAWVRLSDFNKAITQCIELVEATAEEATLQAGRNRRRLVNVGDIGIRCIYCAENGKYTVGSTTYPDNLKTLPHNLYTMVARHFLSPKGAGCCPYIPASQQTALIKAKPNSLSQSARTGGIGLPAYLRMLEKEFGLVNYGQKGGVRVVFIPVAGLQGGDEAPTTPAACK
jgi:hypothetical protein